MSYLFPFLCSVFNGFKSKQFSVPLFIRAHILVIGGDFRACAKMTGSSFPPTLSLFSRTHNPWTNCKFHIIVRYITCVVTRPKPGLLQRNIGLSRGTFASIVIIISEAGTTKIALQVRTLVVAFEHPLKSIKLSVGVLSDGFNGTVKTQINLRRCDASAQIDLGFRGS